jgi:hypothetical protein
MTDSEPINMTISISYKRMSSVFAVQQSVDMSDPVGLGRIGLIESADSDRSTLIVGQHYV